MPDAVNPLVSVIVPVFNVENYLDRCINSICNQTYHNLEILLIDDGSTDNSSSICDIWSEHDSRIKTLHFKNGGVSVARNRGIDLSNGEWILFVDSDDWISPHLIRSCIDSSRDVNADMVFFDFIRIEDAQQPVVEINSFQFSSIDNSKSNKVMSVETALYQLLIGNLDHYLWSYIIKRKAFNAPNQVRLPVGRVIEDMAVTYRLIENSSNILKINKPFYFYQDRANSWVNSVDLPFIQDFVASILQVQSDVSKRYPVLMPAVEYHSFTHLFNCLKLLHNIDANDNSIDDTKKFVSNIIRQLHPSRYYRYCNNSEKIKSLLLRFKLDCLYFIFLDHFR